MSGASGRNKQLLRYAAIFALIVFLASAAMLFLNLWEQNQGVFQSDGSEGLLPTISYNDQEYVLRQDVETLLVMGLDKFDDSIQNDAYTNDQQADFILLLVIDHTNTTCTAIHINRDTMADMSILGVAGEQVGIINKQLALAHTYGNGKEVSCRNTAEAVSNLLFNVKVDHYVSVTMDAVPIYNDLVGGVELTVMDDFSGVDDTLIQGETVTLTGKQALTYIRSRYGMDDSTNNARMKRQQQYMEALYYQSLECVEQSDEFIVDASLELADYMVTSCSAERLQTLFEKISAYDFTEIRTPEGDLIKGEKYMEFYPDVDALKQMVVELFYEPKK
ncbi:MAG: LCP family protein [Clostridia bacterium]|nr:LCP family protein [Clostridia bacterium]